MRIPFMQAAIGAGLAFGLVACGGGGNQAATQKSNAAQPAAQPAASAAATTPAATGRQFRLLPLNESGVNGSVTLTPKGDSVEVAVDATGLPDGAGAYPSHVHVGTCESPGAVVQPLNDVQADSTGEGHATTTVAMAVFKGQQHLVMVHRKDNTLASCATIPADSTPSGM